MRYLSLAIKGIIALIFLLFFLIIAFNNTQLVSFHWFLSSAPIHLPLIVLLFGFFVLGMILGILGMLTFSWKIKRQLAQSKKEGKRLSNEIAKQDSKKIANLNINSTPNIHPEPYE